MLKRLFNTLTKRLFALAVIGTAVALPVATYASSQVKIEGSLGVANVTAGDTKYQHSVNASYDQVVKFQVFYHNREAEDSGKVANNLRVKVNIPSAPGQNQTVSTTISADNSNTVNASAAVQLDRSDAYLEYIPGSAMWQHNVGSNASPNFVETKVSDEVVYGSQGLVLENEKPCYHFSAHLTVLARVRVPGVKIVKQSRVKGSNQAWSNNNTAKPGETMEYLLTYQNIGNSQQNDVVIRDSLPPKMEYVAGSTMLANQTNPGGVKYNSDNLISGGIVIGNYGPGANAFVKFDAKVPSEDKLECGVTEFRNVGVARPKGMNEYYNTAITRVEKKCAPSQPSYSCDLLDIRQGANRTVEITNFKTSASNGATFKNAVVSWGDNTDALTTNNVVGQSHTYAKDGTYTVSAVAHFSVDGADKSAGGAACSKEVTFTTPGTPTTPVSPTTPTQLPNTGVGDVLGIFAATTIAGAIAHKLLWGRRFGRQ